MRSLENLYLVEFTELPLKSIENFYEALRISCSSLGRYMDKFAIFTPGCLHSYHIRCVKDILYLMFHFRLHIHDTIEDLRNKAKNAILQNDGRSNLDANVDSNHDDDVRGNRSMTEVSFVSSTSANKIKQIVNQLDGPQPFMPPKKIMNDAEPYVTISINKRAPHTITRLLDACGITELTFLGDVCQSGLQYGAQTNSCTALASLTCKYVDDDYASVMLENIDKASSSRNQKCIGKQCKSTGGGEPLLESPFDPEELRRYAKKQGPQSFFKEYCTQSQLQSTLQKISLNEKKAVAVI
eukprot:gene15089-6259_t